MSTQGTGVVGANPGSALAARFSPNPHVGDAIVATFFWLGSAHITSVTDRLSGGASVGNTYILVDSISSGGVGMATYIATNAQNFPDTSSDPSGSNLLVVQGNLSASVTDGGVMLSAYSGIQPTYAQAVGPHHARAGSGASTTTADPDSIAVPAGGLAYGVTAGNASPVDRPTSFTQVAHPSDASMVADGEYTVPTSAQTLDPRWTWHFTTQSTWLAEDIALNPSAGGTGPGNLTATTSASTGTTDPDGYTVAVDNGSGQQIGTSASYTFTNLAAGSHSVVLSGVAPNCSVAGGTTRTVTVQSGGTATAAYSVGCSTPSGTGIVFDKWVGTFGNEEGRVIIKGFNPTNPQLGDAIVATFYWVGSTNIIDSVTDVITNTSYTPVGNTFHFVEYRTAGGLSMATYVATNVQHFQGGLYNPGGDQIYAVRANLADSVHGGISLSAFSGVALDYAQALGGHQSASGSAATQTTADAGSLTVASGALVYGTFLAGGQGFAGMNPPAGFTDLTRQSDSPLRMVGDADYAIQGAAGSSDPQWTVFFNSQDTWLVSVLALNPPSGSTNQPPTANFTQSCSTLTCNFTSTSSDPDGSITAYRWTFGDGSAAVTTQNASHTYAAGGTYTVTLQVTDNQGATNSTSQNVTVTPPNQPPVASFTKSCNALTCSFTSTSSDPDGSISAYRWTFGDGSAAVTTQNASHTYTAGGTYTVTLQVTDNQGATNSTSTNITVSAPNSPPVVNAGPDENAVTGLLYSTSVSFSDANHNGPWSYTIDWGDGTSTGSWTAEGSHTISHTYVVLLLRTFTVTVTVTDAAGASGSDSKVVTVLLL